MSTSSPSPRSVNPRSVNPLSQPSFSTATQFSWSDPSQRNPALLLGLLVAGLVVAYANMFVLTSAAWLNPLYSHGWLIPVIAAGLFWVRRQPFQQVSSMERWIGVAILAVGLGVRLLAGFWDMAPLDRLTFLACMLGAFTMVGGWHCLRWAWPSVMFLGFMFPLPSILEHSLLLNLQKVATASSTVVLQIMGIAAFRSGNIITIPGVADNLTVAEQCSGLRMLTIFCSLAVAMVFVIDRPWWDKFIVLLSAIPIAVLSNVVRIVLTALLYMMTADESARHLAHDISGLLMMVWGLGFLWIEFQILSRLSVSEELGRIQPMGTGTRAPIPVAR